MHTDDVSIEEGCITDEAMQAVLKRQCYRCAGCNAPLSTGSTHFNLREGAISGGSQAPERLEALCPFCHRNRMRRIRDRPDSHNHK